MNRVLCAGPLVALLALLPAMSWAQSPASGSAPPESSGQTGNGAASSVSGSPSGTPGTEPQSAATGSTPTGAQGAPTADGTSPQATPAPGATSSSPPGPTYGTRRKLVLLESPPYADPKLYTLSFTLGNSWLKDGSIYNETIPDASFGPNVLTYRLQVGRQLFNQIQIQLDAGYLSATAYNVDTESEEVSDDETLLKAMPLALGAAYRFDYFDEQPVVPYLGLGGAGVLASLKDADVDTATAEVFHRLGGYVGGGLELLLDTFEPARAADLELSSGINDSYVVIDVRYYWLRRYYDTEAGKLTSDWESDSSSDTQWSFSGLQLTAGLKFDF